MSAGGFRDDRKALGIISVIALLCMFFGAVGSNALPADVFGIVERFSTYSAVVYTAFLGAYAYLQLTPKREAIE